MNENEHLTTLIFPITNIVRKDPKQLSKKYLCSYFFFNTVC